MSLHDEVGATLRVVAQAGVSNWQAYVALIGMIVMIGGMVAMMWFLSSQPTSDYRGWLCGGLSMAGLALWRFMLVEATRRAQGAPKR